MPCDTIQSSELELTNPNITLLMQALKELGLNPRLDSSRNAIYFRNGNWQDGTLTVTGNAYSNTTSAEEIKVAYSRQIVGYAAKQFGWKLEESKTTVRAGVAVALKAKKS
jgi:hypothetical protein